VGSKISNAASATKDNAEEAADYAVETGKKALKYAGDAAKNAK